LCEATEEWAAVRDRNERKMESPKANQRNISSTSKASVDMEVIALILLDSVFDLPEARASVIDLDE
jgi:hypothetical protein